MSLHTNRLGSGSGDGLRCSHSQTKPDVFRLKRSVWELVPQRFQIKCPGNCLFKYSRVKLYAPLLSCPSTFREGLEEVLLGTKGPGEISAFTSHHRSHLWRSTFTAPPLDSPQSARVPPLDKFPLELQSCLRMVSARVM